MKSSQNFSFNQSAIKNKMVKSNMLGVDQKIKPINSAKAMKEYLPRYLGRREERRQGRVLCLECGRYSIYRINSKPYGITVK